MPHVVYKWEALQSGRSQRTAPSADGPDWNWRRSPDPAKGLGRWHHTMQGLIGALVGFNMWWWSMSSFQCHSSPPAGDCPKRSGWTASRSERWRQGRTWRSRPPAPTPWWIWWSTWPNHAHIYELGWGSVHLKMHGLRSWTTSGPTIFAEHKHPTSATQFASGCHRFSPRSHPCSLFCAAFAWNCRATRQPEPYQAQETNSASGNSLPLSSLRDRISPIQLAASKRPNLSSEVMLGTKMIHADICWSTIKFGGCPCSPNSFQALTGYLLGK